MARRPDGREAEIVKLDGEYFLTTVMPNHIPICIKLGPKETRMLRDALTKGLEE